jgi:putative endonuclease
MASPSRSHHSKAAKQSALAAGALAEELVARWLLGQGWQILQRRWQCPNGELDLVAQLSPQGMRSPELLPELVSELVSKLVPELVFVEVKARRSGNWDANGLLAVTAQKQSKLWQTAQLFLAQHPHLADCPCRFDVALVRCQPLSKHQPALVEFPASIQLKQPIAIAGYRLSLQYYLPAAFDQG